MNIDQEEIKKFDDMAEDWWDVDGSMKPLHELNPLRLSYIEKYTSLNSKHVLDVGCGGGILTEALAKAGAIATGIDLSEAALNTARSHAEQNKLSINYQNTTVEDFADNNKEKFDVITCLEMLEHVPDPASIINACAKLAKPGAPIFFSTLNRHPKAFLTAILGAEYIMNIIPRGTHQYGKFIKPSELNRWAEAAGLQLKNCQGIGYRLIGKEFYFTDDIKSNYLAYFARSEATKQSL